MGYVESAGGGPGGGPGDAAEAAADEDTFVLPEAWRRAAHPRRGAVYQTVKPIDTGAVRTVEKLVEAAQGSISRALAHPASDPRVVTALREYRAGQADPLGAAAEAAVAGYRRTVELGALADAWAGTHGVLFAAKAIVELYDPPAYLQGDDGSFVLGRSDGSAGARPYEARLRAAADRLRALLAVADDATYQEAVSELGRVRRLGRSGVVAAFLLPTEQHWVDEYCATMHPITYYDTAVLAMLYSSIGSVEQAEKLDWNAQAHYSGLPVDLIATLAGSVGPGIVGLFAHELAKPGSRPRRSGHV